MNNVHVLPIIVVKLSDLFVVTGGWIQIGSLVGLAMGALVLYKFRINKLKHRYAELSLRLEEKNEMLVYSTLNEQKAKERIALSNRAKSDLLARISREIRTPMSGVIGMSSLLAETSLTGEQREYNETVRNCGESLLTVINDILLEDVLSDSKMETGGIELKQKDFDLRNSIEEVLDLFAGKTAGPDVELLYKIDPTVPSYIIADSQRVRQVLMNLVENAVQFTRQGEIMVKVNMIKAHENVVELGFEVCDTGSGIPEDKISSLFRDSTPVNVPTESKRGSGLGLTICKNTVGLMGGKMTVESNLGKGTTIRFTILATASTQSPRKRYDLAGQEGKQILIVDDNLASGTLIKDQLEQWDLRPILASSGKEAMEMLLRYPHFDMVITDRRMPEMNGVQLAQSIQQSYPLIPIILLDRQGESHGQPGLFDSSVCKPIRQHILCEHILIGLKRRNNFSLDVTQQASPKSPSEFSQKHQMRILIAEDNRVNQKLAMKALSKLGYDPDIAANGKEVLEVVSNKKFDLILMDVQMPEMDGLEATRMIRLCLHDQPVIIAMTANSMLGDREECIQAGMDDYISKPVRAEELATMLEKWAEEVKVKL